MVFKKGTLSTEIEYYQNFQNFQNSLKIAGQAETIQTTALLRSTSILRRVLVTCHHSDYSERPSANADVKNLPGVIIMTNTTVNELMNHKINII